MRKNLNRYKSKQKEIFNQIISEIKLGIKESENLEYISIPETVASIKGDLFSHCSGLKKIVVPLHLANQAAEETNAAIIEILR